MVGGPGGDFIAREIKEKQPTKATVKEKGAAAPKEPARRGAIQAARQTKRQIKDVTEQYGNREQNPGNEAVTTMEQSAQNIGPTVMPRPKRKSNAGPQPKERPAESGYDDHAENLHHADPRYAQPGSREETRVGQHTNSYQSPSPNERHRADVIKEKAAQQQANAQVQPVRIDENPVTTQHTDPHQTTPPERRAQPRTTVGKQAQKDSRQHVQQGKRQATNRLEPLKRQKNSHTDDHPQVHEAVGPTRQQIMRNKSVTIPEVRQPKTDAPAEASSRPGDQFRSPRASIIREKPVNHSIKTASRDVRSTSDAIKTPAQVTQAAAQNARKTSQAAQAVAKAGKKTEQTVRKRAAKLSRDALKAIMAALKSLKTTLGAGGAVVVMVLVVILLVGMLLASPFGIFFRSADDGEMTIQTVIVELNNELTQRITDIENSVPHDDVRKDGRSAAMKDVLAVYAVNITTDPDNPLDAVEMDDERKTILTDIFWAMNTITHSTETYTIEETVEVEVEDEDGETHTEEQTQTVEKTRLIITISGKTAQEMATELGFTDVQLRHLEELLSDEYDQLWYGLPMGGSSDIVQVALSQVGNVGGQPYWSWYGFSSRVSWCACFVSWCGDQCGFIEAGILPKFSWCDSGIDWFKARGQWQGRNYVPAPGNIIFFDWGGDGSSDHVGIVEYCDGSYVHTIEGNTSGDMCKQNVYAVGEYSILGYGVYSVP